MNLPEIHNSSFTLKSQSGWESFECMYLLEHDLFTATIVTFHHVWASTASRRVSGYSRACGRATVCVGGLGYTQPYTQPFIPSWDVVHATCVMCRVITDGRVLVRTLRAGQRQAVRSQEVIQVLVAVAGRQRGTTLIALQREWETPKTRVPPRVCWGHGGVCALNNVKLWELLHSGSPKVVRISRVH